MADTGTPLLREATAEQARVMWCPSRRGVLLAAIGVGRRPSRIEWNKLRADPRHQTAAPC